MLPMSSRTPVSNFRCLSTVFYTEWIELIFCFKLTFWPVNIFHWKLTCWPLNNCPHKKWLADHAANENELDEPMGILPSPHIRSGHSTHHRGPISLSSQISPPSYILSLFILPPLLDTCLSPHSYSSWSSGDGRIPCLLPHLRCNGFWSWALLCSSPRWLPYIHSATIWKFTIKDMVKIILGILLSYSAPFILLARPSPVSCAVLRWCENMILFAIISLYTT